MTDKKPKKKKEKKDDSTANEIKKQLVKMREKAKKNRMP
jgi:hypothetical protein